MLYNVTPATGIMMTTDYLQATIISMQKRSFDNDEVFAISLGGVAADARDDNVYILYANSSLGKFKHLDTTVNHRVVDGKLYLHTSTDRQLFLRKVWSLRGLLG